MANRSITSIAAQAVCERLPLPAYGYHFNRAMPLTILKPACAWAVHPPRRQFLPIGSSTPIEFVVESER